MNTFVPNAPFNNIPTIILLGGKGTRIASRFPDLPKVLIPVHGRPFLEWQLDHLRTLGCRNILLAAGHKADILADYLAKRPPDSLSLSITVEPSPLGTGGALRHALPRLPILPPRPILVLNGDSLSPNLSLPIFHTVENIFPHDGKPAALLFVTPIQNAGRFGTVEFSLDGLVTAFREKTSRTSGWINTGIYLFNRSALELIPPNRPSSIETELFPTLIARHALQAIPISPPLLDMGTPDGLIDMGHYLSKKQP